MKVPHKDFIQRLKRARAAIVKGDTGCQAQRKEAAWCHRCAMVNRSGPTDFWRWTGPEADWSLDKTRDDVLAMFDASIRALRPSGNSK